MGTTTRYEPRLTLGEARRGYFVDNGFGETGNYDEPFVKVSLGPIPIRFPNTEARIRAVRYHDLHHVLTGYATTLEGEAEIGAWELGSGCGAMPAAWILNALAIVLGLVVAPCATFAAFLRGRHTRNLYREPALDPLLGRVLGEERARLGLDREDLPGARLGDWLAFGGYVLAGLALFAAVLSLLALPWVALASLAAVAL